MRASQHISDICNQCSLYTTYAPTIVSACLVSLEPDSQFRMMTDQVTPDERFGQQSANSNLSTPEDASCTHILVFPTSATTRVSIPDFRNFKFNAKLKIFLFSLVATNNFSRGEYQRTGPW